MSKSIKALFVLARPAFRSHRLARSQHSILRQRGQVNVQPVRFRSPPLRYGRIIRVTAQFALTCYLFYLINEYVLGYEEEDEEPEAETTTASIAVAPKTLREGAEGTKAPEAEQVEELLAQLPDKLPEDAIFIPLWWAKERPPTFYQRSDPEWQGFVKFARDRKRAKEVKEALATHIEEISSKNPQWTKFLGAPVRLTHFWLDFDFPLSPPPEYDRPGIEITDNYVALTSRPQSQEHYKRVKAALWPEAITKSFYYSFRMYWSLQYVRLKGYLNLKTTAEDPRPQMSPDPLNLHKMTKNPDKQEPQMDAKLDKLSDPKASDTKASGSGSAGIGSPKPPATGISPDSAKILSYLPSLKKSEGDLGSAVNTFKRTLLQTWNPPAIIDRGAFAVSGLVEVAGSKAKIVVDVIATFHPETNQLKVLAIRPRRAAPLKLVPKG